MVHIRKINTMYGLRYAVVEPMTVVKEKPIYKIVEGKDGKPFKKRVKTETSKETVYHTVELSDNRLAMFPVNAYGLLEAKEVQKEVKKNLKKVS